MATIYRFIVEQKQGGSSGRKGGGTASGSTRKKTVAKKGKAVSLLGGEKGGVEHNRKLRAINPLINRATGGAWEKGMRVGRAGLGLIQVNSETGAFMGLSAVSIAILFSFAIQTTLKIQAHQKELATKRNNQNFKALENGFSAVHGEYSVARNFWDGRIDYNQNK